MEENCELEQASYSAVEVSGTRTNILGNKYEYTFRKTRRFTIRHLFDLLSENGLILHFRSRLVQSPADC